MNPKQKGNTFEREMSKTLSNYLTEGKSDIAIWRTDTSGARNTYNSRRGNETNKDNFGDIKQVVEKGLHLNLDKFFEKFSIELKFYQAIDYRPPVKGKLKDFFEQSIEQGKQSDKHFLLIVKENRKEILLFTNYNKFSISKQSTYYYNNLEIHCYRFTDVFNTEFSKLGV